MAAAKPAPKKIPPLVAKTDAKPVRGLLPTLIPGVYKNRMGVDVDAHGVAISFTALKDRDRAYTRENLEGRDADTPADFLDSVWKNPRLSASVRMDAAKASAPYRNQKLIGLSGVVGAPAIEVSYTKDTDAELEAKMCALAEVLKALGVDV